MGLVKIPASISIGVNPGHAQKLRCGAFPESGFAGGGAEVGAETELVEFSLGRGWTAR